MKEVCREKVRRDTCAHNNIPLLFSCRYRLTLSTQQLQPLASLSWLQSVMLETGEKEEEEQG
jgi:hypothetical protein